MFFTKAPTITKEIELEQIGPILLVQKKENRNFRITVKPFGSVRVSFPRHMSFEKAEKKLKNKITWLVKTKNKMKEYEIDHVPLSKEDELGWRREAKKYLPLRVRELSIKYDLPYRSLSIRRSRTRWGSCSGRNKINLSFYLMRLPEELIDYVIMHELVHTREHNHSQKYWQLLEKYWPEARLLEKRLKQHRILIY